MSLCVLSYIEHVCICVFVYGRQKAREYAHEIRAYSQSTHSPIFLFLHILLSYSVSGLPLPVDISAVEIIFKTYLWILEIERQEGREKERKREKKKGEH